MRKAAIVGVASLLCAAQAASASQLAPRVVSSTIKHVTVYSDRARVTREASVAIGARTQSYVFRKLPGWVDDASVRLSLSPARVGRIVDVRVKREFLARATDATYQSAEAAVQRTTAELAALNDEIKILEAQAKQIAAIEVFSMKKLSKDVLVRDIKIQTYGQVVAFITDSLRKTAAQRRAIEAKRQQLVPRLSAQQRRLAALRKLNRLEQTTVFVTLTGAVDANGTLRLTYMLPGATWEPLHELRAQGKNPRSAEVLSFARVTQASGEDWRDIDISFSTQSSTESIRIPGLASLTLGETRRTTRIMRRRTTSFKRAQMAFQQQNRLWNEVNQKVRHHRFKQVYEDNFQILNSIQSKTVQIFKTLRRRGTTTHFRGLGKASIRSDGHRARVRIAQRSLAAVQKIVAAPEQSLNAARTLEMTNATAQPLLPGKVALYHDSAFLGMTEMGFVAPGETFSLFLNVADQIKLSRVLDRKHSSIVRKMRTRMNVAFNVTVENLSGERVSLSLADRIPISENKAIRIDGVKISPRGQKPDAKGLLKWALTLAPRQKRVFRLQYRVEYPPSLILSMNRAEQSERQLRRRYPARPMARRKRSISRDIQNLEQAF